MLLKLFSILPLLLLILSCKEVNTSSNPPETTVIVVTDTSDTNKIFIEDRTGKKWDITHAVKEYGFNPDNFQYGLGPYAIRPLLEPNFVSPGHSDFNSLEASTAVIGTTINEITRAYPLYMVGRYEIIDEEFDRTFVAVGY